jgi:hypothetical protein
MKRREFVTQLAIRWRVPSRRSRSSPGGCGECVMSGFDAEI